MVDFVPNERATPIRVPSTANLMIDSIDRDELSPWDFQITKNYSILNGFFTRIGTTEVVLEWCQPNISSSLGNNQLVIDVSGTGGNTYSGTETITFTEGFYTVAQALGRLTSLLNDISGTTGMTFGTATNALTNQVQVISVGGDWAINAASAGLALALQIGLPVGLNNTLTSIHSIVCPDLRPYRYIDFVSAQLTYNQDLKDSSTNNIVRDVLCRWYFDWYTPPDLDSLGFPIFMGYTAFRARRLFNPPKQIKWSPNQPIGNLSFQVYGNTVFGGDPELVPLIPYAKSNWLMTLQVSEV